MPAFKDYESTALPSKETYELFANILPNNEPLNAGHYKNNSIDEALALQRPKSRSIANIIGDGITIEGLIRPADAEMDSQARKRPGWHDVDLYQTPEAISVRTGQKGGWKYIIDPYSYKPVTPAFHELENLTDDGAIISIGAGHYAFYADSPPLPERVLQSNTGSYATYPDFLFAEKLRIEPYDETQHWTLTNPHHENIFGLEKPVDHIALKGQQIFDDTLKKVMAFATNDKVALQQLREPDTAVTLPVIDTPQLTAQLRFRTFDNGTNILFLDGLQDNGTSEGGFLLVQAPGASVSIFPSSLDRMLTSSDPDYLKFIRQAGDYLSTYFQKVRVKNSSEILSGKSMFDIRQQLGNMTVKEAQKKLKSAIK